MDTNEINLYQKFIALNLSGGDGSGAELTCALNYETGGSVHSFSINQSGTGYMKGQQVRLSDQYSALAWTIFTVESIDENGAVLSLSLYQQGNGYQGPSLTDAETATISYNPNCEGLTIDVVFQYSLKSIDIVSGGHGYLSQSDSPVGYPVLNFLTEVPGNQGLDLNVQVVDGSITQVFFSGGAFLTPPDIEVVTKKATDTETLLWNLVEYDRKGLIPRLKEAVQDYRQTNVIYPESFEIMNGIDEAIDNYGSSDG